MTGHKIFSSVKLNLARVSRKGRVGCTLYDGATSKRTLVHIIEMVDLCIYNHDLWVDDSVFS